MASSVAQVKDINKAPCCYRTTNILSNLWLQHSLELRTTNTKVASRGSMGHNGSLRQSNPEKKKRKKNTVPHLGHPAVAQNHSNLQQSQCVWGLSESASSRLLHTTLSPLLCNMFSGAPRLLSHLSQLSCLWFHLSPPLIHGSHLSIKYL